MDISEEVLQTLINHPEIFNSLSLAENLAHDHQKVIGALKSLENLDMIITEPVTKKTWQLTEEGNSICHNGSYEVILYNSVPETGISQEELSKIVPNFKIGFSKAMSKNWIHFDKCSGVVSRKNADSDVVDEVQKHLAALCLSDTDISDDLKREYKKRKLLTEVTVKSFNIKRGPEFGSSLKKLETEFTPELIASEGWKTAKFKPYNFKALGLSQQGGSLHPLLKMRSEFRQIFLEMGFTEMPTNNYVENSFWNFDSLFQPQQHPARDAHDTFFLVDPANSLDMPPEYAKRVEEIHSKGGHGSQGYNYKWSRDEAAKNLLRTHTTAVSARMLYKLAQTEFEPRKYFSIDRVFRNETLDATHLAEFHQVEGVIIDYKLTLGDLIGTLSQFFKKLGIEKLKYKPAYNPYTEPSMEIFCYHEGLKKWIEVGNSGMFRPEMLLPMGLPKKVNAIAWGLSLERPTMIKYAINNIRDLVGPRINLQNVYDSPICRLDS